MIAGGDSSDGRWSGSAYVRTVGGPGGAALMTTAHTKKEGCRKITGTPCDLVGVAGFEPTAPRSQSYGRPCEWVWKVIFGPFLQPNKSDPLGADRGRKQRRMSGSP